MLSWCNATMFCLIIYWWHARDIRISITFVEDFFQTTRKNRNSFIYSRQMRSLAQLNNVLKWYGGPLNIVKDVLS